MKTIEFLCNSESNKHQIIADNSQEIQYQEFWNSVDRTTEYLTSIGIREQDTIGLLMDNRINTWGRFSRVL